MCTFSQRLDRASRKGGNTYAVLLHETLELKVLVHLDKLLGHFRIPAPGHFGCELLQPILCSLDQGLDFGVMLCEFVVRCVLSC